MVEVDGTGRPSRSRCHAMVAWARVQAGAGELRPEGDDPAARGVGCPVRAGVRPPGSRLEFLEAALPVPPQEAVQVPAADPVPGRRGGDGQLR